jgi:AraC family transcriptional regulator
MFMYFVCQTEKCTLPKLRFCIFTLIHEMTPKIELINAKKIIGIKHKMSLTQFTVSELWKRFMPRRKEIKYCNSNNLISLAIYDSGYFDRFSPDALFERWAAVEVHEFDSIPEGMEPFVIPAGLYAVFHYKGDQSDTTIFQYIFESWLPSSEYVIDERPHFEILSNTYKNNDPQSEEEIWIPIKLKQ